MGVGPGASGLQVPPLRTLQVLRARFAVPGPLLGQIAASWPIRARIDLNLRKLSQNGEVSTKYVEKASHSPCFQKLIQKSPLEFLRFPVLRAFSHKELMVPFWPWDGLYCQNDEVSPVWTPMLSRERVTRYPHGSTQQAAPVDPLLIWLRAVFSTGHVLGRLHLIMTETGIPGH